MAEGSKNTVEIILSAKDQASEALKKAFENVHESNSKFMGGLVSAKTVIAGAFTALGGYLVKTGVEYDAMAEQSTVAWTTLLGSQEKAKKMLVDLANFAKTTPFQTQDVDMMAKYLHNAGMEGQTLFNELSKISDVSSAFNISADNAKTMTMEMSHVAQSGRAYAKDLNELQNKGVPIYKAIGQEMHITTGEVKKMGEQGKITSAIYFKAFDDISNSVKGASKAQSQTFNGLLTTLKDDWLMIAGALSKPIFAVLKQGLADLIPLMDALQALTKGDMTEFANTLTNAFGPTVSNMVVSFTKGLMDGFNTIGQYVNKGKQALLAFFDFMKGDWMGGITILTKMGLDTKQVVMIDHAFTDVRNFAIGFVKGVQTVFNNLFSGKNNLGTSFISVFNTIKGVVFPILGDIVAVAKDAFTKLADFWNKNGATITANIKQSIKDISDVLTILKPILNAVFTVITVVGIKVFNDFIDVVKLIGNNLKWLTPIAIGLGAAIGAYKMISGIITLFQAFNAISKIIEATWAVLDIVLSANPLGLIAIAIGVLVAAGILLYQNWGTVSNKMQVIWMEIKGAAVDAINTIIDKINGMIGIINKIPGVSIPIVPKISQAVVLGTPAAGTAPSGNGRIGGRASTSYATGTDNHPGGYALVGENGPEVVNLPQGTQVFDANKSKKMMGQKTNIYNLKVINNQNMDEQTLIRYFQRMEALNHG